MTVAMLIAGFLTLLSAVGVVVSSKPLNSALWLVLTLFLVAVHFALLGADFIATMQILIYAGAIMVLVIFVIMLLGVEATEDNKSSFLVTRFIAALATGGFITAFYLVVINGGVSFSPHEAVEGFGSPESVGEVMFTKFLLPFEMIGLLLLAAIIGAFLLAHDKKRPLPEGRGLKAKRGAE